jgi:hypothetical protein
MINLDLHRDRPVDGLDVDLWQVVAIFQRGNPVLAVARRIVVRFEVKA